MLALKAVTHTVFPRHTLLHGVNFELTRGMRLAIMGLNGAGKTTLLKIMSGCLHPSNGSVLWEGRDLHHLPHKERAQKIAFVPQDFPTEFPFTVEDFVLMGRFPHQAGIFFQRGDHDFSQAVLKRLSLYEFKRRLVSTLSGGERQRLLLARALTQASPVIMLDEPVNHLDVKHRYEILNLLRQEGEKNGKTIVAVMHEVRDVGAYFTHVLFLHRGVSLALGPVAKLMEDGDLLQKVFEMPLRLK